MLSKPLHYRSRGNILLVTKARDSATIVPIQDHLNKRGQPVGSDRKRNISLRDLKYIILAHNQNSKRLHIQFMIFITCSESVAL